MFSYIKGSLDEKSNHFVVVETAGIGYQIFMSETAMASLGELGSIVKIHTHYHVREDEISLYGFLSNEELKMFELLLSVSGIGAKSAITMLSNITPSEFALCILNNDLTKLTKVPGIGKKTAQRIVLELTDKLNQEQAASAISEEIKQMQETKEEVTEAISALQMLGYNQKEIEKALEKIEYQTMSIEEMIRATLKQLSK